jgi:hypothetical protein
MADPVTLGALALTAAGTAVSAAGTIAGGNAAARAGGLAEQSYEFRAQQEEMAADEARAMAQRTALDRREQGKLLLSKLQARAAATGGAADPTVVDLAGNIAGRSEYEALFEMARGESKARGLEDQAMGSRLTGFAAREEGEAKRKASRLAALGTIIGGAGSAFRRYNPRAREPLSLDDINSRYG